ncbi:MAG: molybdenum ABC transporter ATP-binding protein [Chloroflexi bacterium]|nr:molybdenum ABC transporter ATP-binding protein [Chloroflexota bacterium]
MISPIVDFHIVKKYPNFTLDCRASFESGVTAVFGASGSGKSTLLNCIAGTVHPDEGHINFRGRRFFSSASGEQLPPDKRRFGYVFQHPALFPHMNVKSNIMYGFKLTPESQRKIRIEQVVDLFQLSDLMGRRTDNLSGGERQRVALARALATSPDLLLLDEPLASLDGAFRGVIIEYLKRVSRELGTPMIYVSHSISEVMALADRMLVLRNGRPVTYGNVSSALVHPGLADIADYTTLENLLEAEVMAVGGSGGLAELRVGDATLVAPKTHREPGEKVMVSIRAGDIILAGEIPARISARNTIRSTIREIHILDSSVLIYADIGVQVIVEITQASLTELDLKVGEDIFLIIKTNSVVVLDAPGSSS